MKSKAKDAGIMSIFPVEFWADGPDDSLLYLPARKATLGLDNRCEHCGTAEGLEVVT